MTLRHESITELYRRLAIRTDELKAGQQGIHVEGGRCLSPAGGRCFCPVRPEFSENLWVDLRVELFQGPPWMAEWIAWIKVYDPAIPSERPADPGRVHFSLVAIGYSKDGTVAAEINITPESWSLSNSLGSLVKDFEVSYPSVDVLT